MPSPLTVHTEARFLPTNQGLPIGLGCAPLGNLFQAISDEQAQALIELALADALPGPAGRGALPGPVGRRMLPPPRGGRNARTRCGCHNGDCRIHA